MSISSEKLKIFSSYARSDREFVDRLESALEAQDITAFVDRDDIHTGEEWWKRIQALIEQSDTIVFVLSPDSVSSPICQQEVELAESLNKRIVPVVAQNLAGVEVPPGLARLNYAFFVPNQESGASGDFDQSFSQLTDTLLTDITWIREHTRLGVLAQRWVRRGRSSDLALRGRELMAAETWLVTRPQRAPIPTDAHNLYISQSRRAATRRQRYWLGGSVTVALVATSLAGLAYWQRTVAVENELTAVKEREKATIRRETSKAFEKYSQGHVDSALASLLKQLELISKNNFVNLTETKGMLAHVTHSSMNIRRYLDVKATFRVSGVDYSPDGKRIALGGCANSSCSIGRLQVRRKDGVIEKQFDALAGQISDVKFHPSGRSIALASSQSDVIRIKGLEDNSPDQTIRLGSWPVTQMAFHPTGPWLAFSAWGSEAVVIWNLKNRTPITKILDPLRRRGANRVSISADGKWLAAGYRDDGVVKLWQLQVSSGSVLESISIKSHQGREITALAFNRTGSILATGAKDNVIRLWDVSTGAAIGEPLEGHRNWIEDLKFTPDGSTLISASRDKTIRIWDTTSQRQVGRPLRGHHSLLQRLAFHPTNGLEFISTAQDKKAIVWRLDPRRSLAGKLRAARGQFDIGSLRWSKKTTWPRRGRPQPLVSLSAAPDGRHLALGVAGDVIVRDQKTRMVKHKLRGDGSLIWSLAYDPRGRYLAAGSKDGQIRLWDPKSGKLSACLLPSTGRAGRCNDEQQGPKASIAITLVFHPGGKYLASIFSRSGLTLWDMEKLQSIPSFTKRKYASMAQAHAVAFHPTRPLMAISGYNGYVELIDLETGHSRKLEGQDSDGLVRTIAFDLTGKHLASANDTFSIAVWNVDENRLVAKTSGPTNWIMGLRYGGTPEEQILITVLLDGQIVIWDAKNYEPISLPISAHHSWVRAVDLSRDAATLFTGDADGNILAWPMLTDAWRREACDILNPPAGSPRVNFCR